jgi:hypothetical protein
MGEDTEREIEWPREIWLEELDEHHNGRGYVVLSQAATIMRHEGDLSRDCEFQRYVDGDIHESAEKYWQSRIEALTAERDAAYLAGVKAGLEAAGDAQHFASRALRQLGYSSFCDSLDECTRQIRALDPAAIARAQKENPNG